MYQLYTVFRNDNFYEFAKNSFITHSSIGISVTNKSFITILDVSILHMVFDQLNKYSVTISTHSFSVVYYTLLFFLDDVIKNIIKTSTLQMFLYANPNHLIQYQTSSIFIL